MNLYELKFNTLFAYKVRISSAYLSFASANLDYDFRCKAKIIISWIMRGMTHGWF